MPFEAAEDLLPAAEDPHQQGDQQQRQEDQELVPATSCCFPCRVLGCCHCCRSDISLDHDSCWLLALVAGAVDDDDEDDDLFEHGDVQGVEHQVDFQDSGMEVDEDDRKEEGVTILDHDHVAIDDYDYLVAGN